MVNHIYPPELQLNKANTSDTDPLWIYIYLVSNGFVSYSSDQFRRIIIRHKRIGYNLNVMRQSACLVINPITVNKFAALFNCKPVDRASESTMTPT